MGPCRALLLLLGLGLAGASTAGPHGATAGATAGATDGATVGATDRATAGATDGATAGATDGATAEWEGTTVASPEPLSYGDVVAAAVELLNARAVSPYVLRLREAQPRPGWPWDLQSRRELSFTLEETTCQAPGTATSDCKSLWLRTVTWCQGSVFLEGQQPTVQLSCEKAPAAFGPIWKSKIKGFFGKVKQQFRGFLQCGRIWIRDRLNLKTPRP